MAAGRLPTLRGFPSVGVKSSDPASFVGTATGAASFVELKGRVSQPHPNGQIVEFVYSANPALKTWSTGGAQVARSKMRIRVTAVPCVEETTLFV